MIINFIYPDGQVLGQKASELERIILAELEKHFTGNKWSSARYFLKDTTKYGKSVTVIIDNNAYLQDLQNAKTRMSEMEHKYMTDFVSDVEENLSFVVQIYGSDE